MRLILGNLPNALWWALGAVLVAGACCVSYGVFIERRWYRATTYRLPVLPAEASTPLTLLHLSDLHFTRRDDGKARFLASLPRPDVLVVTGDLVGEPDAVEATVEALAPVRGRHASYVVLGSNDYYVPRPVNYAKYFLPRRRGRRTGRRGRTGDLIRMLETDGWVHLRNRRADLTADGVHLEVVGLDDPHLGRHDLRTALRTDPGALGLALVHSPEPAPELAALGYQLILCGHTHGGQVRLPFIGALVTNSTIPTRLCMGLSRLGPALLHVSPGLGTSKYAPFRFLCRPEATVLELVSSDGPRAQPSATARSNTRS